MAQCYTISCPDNDSEMWESSDPHVYPRGVPGCAECGVKSDPYIINQAFQLKRRNHDLSYTYDGYCISSLKVKEVCVRHNISGVEFLCLPSEPTYFVLKPTATVAFDAVRRQTIFEHLCPVCGKYGGIFGATPAFLLQTPVTDISGTDIFFGSGNARHTLVIVTEHVKSLFSCESITGIAFKVAHV